MTAPDLADALAAQRAAFRPEHVPPFTELLGRKRRRDRRRQALAVTAAVGAAAVLAGTVTALPTWNRPDSVTGELAADQQATQPDQQSLRDALAALTPPIVLPSVQPMKPGESGIGDRPRRQIEGVTGQTADSTTSVSWAILSPALTEVEAIAVAGQVEGSNGLEQGAPVGQVDQDGPVKSIAYRFDGGTFITLWAWSTDGGVVTITSGDGAAVSDAQIMTWQQTVAELLER